MVSFDHLAYPGTDVIRNMGTGFDLGPVVSAIQNLHPAGATSIGAGVALGRSTLNPVSGYDRKALVVFTDGLENTAPRIADVLSSTNDRTFAIGQGHDLRLCALLECLLRPEALLKCIECWCKELPVLTPDEIREREGTVGPPVQVARLAPVFSEAQLAMLMNMLPAQQVRSAEGGKTLSAQVGPSA